MSEQKKPEAGEFWECNERVQIVGTLSDGATVGETSSGSIRTFKHENGWRYLPECNSFEWQPETFPQWYICGNPIGWGLTAYVVRDSQTTYFCVDTNGVESRSSAYWWDQSLVTSGAWKQVTQAEAEARVKKPVPVESPDDWVTQDRVPVRVGIDQESWSNWTVGRWEDVGHWHISNRYGMRHGDCDRLGDRVPIRCRRKDLPALPETLPKTYVRLWLNQQSGHVSITDAKSTIELVGCDELKHDGTGFYLEGGK